VDLKIFREIEKKRDTYFTIWGPLLGWRANLKNRVALFADTGLGSGILE